MPASKIWCRRTWPSFSFRDENQFIDSLALEVKRITWVQEVKAEGICGDLSSSKHHQILPKTSISRAARH